MSYAIYSTLAEADAYEATCRKALSLPSKGTHVGGGRHVPMTEDPQSPGWTTAWSDVRKHPGRDKYAVAALDPQQADRDRLSTQERTAVDDAYATRAALDDTWTEADKETATARSR